MSLRSSLFGRRTVVSVAAAAVAMGSSVLAVSGASSAVAAPHGTAFTVTSYSLSASAHVKTTSKKKLSYNIGFNHSSTDTGMNAGLFSSTSEEHFWDFTLTAKSLKINAATGTGTIDTKTLLKKFGRMRLKLTSAGKAKKQTTCTYTGGFVTDRPIKLTGTPKFNTNTGKHGWGLVGTRKITMRGDLSTTYGNPSVDCPTSPIRCPSAEISVSHSDETGGVGADAFSIRKHTASVDGFRSVELKSPKNARRFDEILGTGPALKATKSGKNVAVKITGASHNVTGSATVVSSGAPNTSVCKKTTTEKQYSAIWKNGPKKLTFHEQIEGNFSPKPGGFNSFEVITKK
jgi:hypothetical protein